MSAGEVGAGVGLGEALAPDVVAAQHRGAAGRVFCSSVPYGHDRRRDVGDAEHVERARRAGAVQLLGPHHLLHHARRRGRRTRPATRSRRSRRRRARAFHALAGASSWLGLVEARGRRRRRPDVVGDVGVEPGPELGPERLGLGGVGEVHAPGTVRNGAPGPDLDNAQISSYKYGMVRRKPGTLLPLEVAILDAGTAGARDGDPEFHGFAVAQRIQERDGARRLTAHGTLYKALGRLEAAGCSRAAGRTPSSRSAEGRPASPALPGHAARRARVRRARADAASDAAPGFRPGW